MPPPIVTIGKRLLADLDRRFDNLDTDDDDEIELQELFKLYKAGDGEAEAILRFYDADGDNVIDREEFRKVGLILLSNQKFYVADVDDSGHTSALSWSEFLNAMKEMGFSKKFARKIFEDADANKNGEIEQMEFLNAMLMFISDWEPDDETASQASSTESEPEPKPKPEPKPMRPPRSTLGSKLMDILGEAFDSTDLDGNGSLTDVEIAKVKGVEVKTIKKIMEYADINGTGSISRQEFINVGLLMSIKELFQEYDINKNGSLSMPELSDLLQDLGYEQEELQAIFDKADINSDGSISEMEFYTAILFTISAPKTTSQMRVVLNSEIDDMDDEINFPEEVRVNTETLVLYINLKKIYHEEFDGNKRVKRKYNVIFPTKLQGKLLDDEEEEEEDLPSVSYEMDPRFNDGLRELSGKQSQEIVYDKPILMDNNDTKQITLNVKMTFDKLGVNNSIVTGTKEVQIPLKIQTLKKAMEDELHIIAETLINLDKQ